jgi:hypothetical protein
MFIKHNNVVVSKTILQIEFVDWYRWLNLSRLLAHEVKLQIYMREEGKSSFDALFDGWFWRNSSV